MSMLGPFAEGFATWRRILGTVRPEAQLKIFGNAVEEVASFVARGLDRAIAADELADMALSIGFEDTDEVQSVIAGAFSRVRVNGPDDVVPDAFDADARYDGNGQAAPAPHYATKYEAIDPLQIPQRAWLYGGHYIRQTVSATVAPGGWGKTTLQLYEALQMVHDGVRVWYVSGEDPHVELDRRIAAHCQLHNLVLADCRGQLFVDDSTTFPLSIARMTRARDVELNERALAAFEAAIVHDKIDVTILDPFISFHGVPENDNAAIDGVVKRLVATADRTNSSIEIGHHVRKGVSAGIRPEITVDDARGGSAIIGAVRSARVINRMNAIEGDLAKIDANKRHWYVRVDIGKRNMAPPPEHATWYRLVNVPLANGDHVQALSAWEFPTIFADVAVHDTEHIRELVRRKPYRADTRSDEWLGLEVAKRLRLNVNDKADVIRIQRLIGVWLSNNVFAKKEIHDPASRRPRMYYVAPATPPPPDNVVPFFRDDDDD